MEYSLVIGASGGIGKEICKKLLKTEPNLIISGRSSNKLELLKSELRSLYPNANVITYPINLENELERRDFFTYVKEKGYRINGLYYSAGIDTRKPFLKYTDDKIIRQARVNFEGALSLTKFALDNRAQKLKILIVSSACGATPMPYFSEYSATKSALIYFYKALKKELKDKTVKITVLCPGSVPTRPDIVEDIQGQGFLGKLSKKSPSYIVDKAFKSLEKNKTICVPGLYNKLTFTLAKITPYPIQASIVAKKFKDKEKDAF